MSINIAIIGCGRVAGHHVKAINNNSNLKLISVADIDSNRIQEIQKITNVPCYLNYHDMFKTHPNIDVVSIITPSGMHFEHALDAIKIYKKHVVIEKPIVMTIAQGAELEAAASISNVNIFPVHQYRFNRCVQRIKQAIENDELGKIFLSTVRMRWCRPQNYYDRDAWRGTYALDGGCTTNQGIHHLDLLRYLNGEVKRVNAVMKTFGAEIEVEDTVIALLEFENGSVGNLEITTASRPDDFESSLSVMGSKGLAMLGGAFTDKLLEFSPDTSQKKLYSDNFQDAYGYGHNRIYEGVYLTLKSVGQPALSFSDGMKTIQLLHAIYASAEQNNWVNIKDSISSSKLGVSDENIMGLYRTFRENVV
jgi:predicted dehydrogenase